MQMEGGNDAISNFFTEKAISIRTQTQIDKNSVGLSAKTKSVGPRYEDAALSARTMTV